ncbi:glycosyltransferase family 4 protein [Ancylobacter sp. MQZ15Z-1]|uniref:Glycosyltransferase family 4 protein n=1 Tax=Ancylobacter mangrovi TaxID=2972472 RepID=A0A9X2PDF6_9HYPH|nr:glycosyltransferase family 1 protein [Ancylobacter mangrovi]MCS0493950.1 glycosyltransferase family 4 protein [Ancylobacter mangrovi]
MIRCWTINGRFLTQPLTGVQRYAHGIVAALDRLIADRHPLAQGLELELVTPKNAEDYALGHIAVRRVGELRGHLWEQFTLPGQVRGGLLSLCNTGPLAVARQILCIHDTNISAFPQSYSLRYRLLHRLFLPLLARRVARVVTVSSFSAAELARSGIRPEAEISVIPCGHEHALTWTPKHSEATRRAAGSSTIVVLGSPAPHKNIGMLLDLAPRLAAVGFRLALVGALDSRVFQSAPGAAADNANVTVLGRLTDNELAALLTNSLCLAFPSYAEGFGLPPLEAMALGCPVVVSDRASLPEICGAAALYAAPDQPEAWLDAFKQLRAEPALRFKLVATGRENAKKYRWSTSAEAYLAEMAIADGLVTRREDLAP